MTLVHVREKDLQTATFTAQPDLTTEAGVTIHEEDGTTAIQLDGTASWSIQIIHAPPKDGIVHVDSGELASVLIGGAFTLINQDVDVLVNQDGDILVAVVEETQVVTLIHV